MILCRTPRPLSFLLGLAAGVAVGAALHQMAVWIAVGAGLGVALSAGSRPAKAC